MAYSASQEDFAAKLNQVTTQFIKMITKAKAMKEYINELGGKDAFFVADADGNFLNWNGINPTELWSALKVFEDIDAYCKLDNRYKKLYSVISPVIE